MKSVKKPVKIRVCKGEAVSERLEIDANSGFMVTYNSDNDIVEVCDDLEVNEFMDFVVKSSRIVTLCIVASSVNDRQLSTTGNNQQSNFIHATPILKVIQLIVKKTGWWFTEKQKPDERDLLDDEKLQPFGEKVMGSVFGKVKRLSGEDESSESDDESSESDEEGSESDEDAETTPVKNKNLGKSSLPRSDEHKRELTPWAEAKLAQRIAKSATWTVRPAANYLYNVVDYYKNATVDLNTRTCSCGQWQLSGLPCGHLIAVMRHLRQSSANQFAFFHVFKTSGLEGFIQEVIYESLGILQMG
ncbi:probable purine permease 11 [Tanacetum coccineum]